MRLRTTHENFIRGNPEIVNPRKLAEFMNPQSRLNDRPRYLEAVRAL
jgi:hypothetical protein